MTGPRRFRVSAPCATAFSRARLGAGLRRPGGAEKQEASMSDTGAPLAFELIRRPPSQRTAGLIAGMTGYRESVPGRFSQRETAPLVVPLIISIGTPFLIAFRREPNAA